MSDAYLFTSESVSEGHPDKISDQISDAVLDAIIAEDSSARVACETLVTTGLVLIAGEMTTTAYLDLIDIVRSTVRDIGYTKSDHGFHYDNLLLDQVTVREPKDPVHTGREIEIMGRQYRCDALFPHEPHEFAEDQFGGVGVQIAGGFVRQKDFRLVRDSTRDGDALLFAAR